MGHKVHPMGFRLGVIRDWQSKWYADKHYADFLQEDLKLRDGIKTKYADSAGVSTVEIERQSNQVTITVHTSRPGIVIGRGGQRVDETRHYLEQLIDKKIQLNIQEIQQPELDAYLVARSVAEQIERRVAYRRAMKQAMFRTMQAGAKGMKINCAGRLGGAEIARSLNMHEGRVPLHTLRADIDYGFCEAHTVMGRIGIKVWIYKGEILPEAKELEALEEIPPGAVSADGADTKATTKEEPVAEAAAEEPKAKAEEAQVKPVAEAAAEKPKAKAEEAQVEPVAEAVAEKPKAKAEPVAEAAEEKPKAKAKKAKDEPVAEAVEEKPKAKAKKAKDEPVAEAVEEKPKAKAKKAKAEPVAEAAAEEPKAEEASTEEEPEKDKGDTDGTA